MTKPTGLDRDSSLKIGYGPRDCEILSGSADRKQDITPTGLKNQRRLCKSF